MRGFCLRITKSARYSATKTFVVEKRVQGKTVRIVVGQYPQLTVGQARTAAQALLGRMALGINPQTERREARARSATLGEVWTEFQRSRKLKPTTLIDYQRVMEQTLADWQNRPWVEITGAMVTSRHRKLGAESGHAAANLAMRVLRSVLNFAIGTYRDSAEGPLIAENPVTRLRHTKAWYKVNRRTGHIEDSEIAAWWKSVLQLDDSTARDYLIFVLLTGLRRREAERIRINDIHLEDHFFRVHDTKNGQPLSLPLSGFLFELVSRRVNSVDGEFLFPSSVGEGHFTEIRAQIKRVRATSGVQFTIHDLRRTFATVAESVEIPAYALKALLNHRSNSGDVTAGYVQIGVNRLRVPMQKITDYIVKRATEAGSNVVPIRAVDRHPNSEAVAEAV